MYRVKYPTLRAGKERGSFFCKYQCVVFIEVVFLMWGGVFRLKHHLKPKKAEIIGVVFRSGSVYKSPVMFL